MTRRYHNEGDDQFNFENVHGDVNIRDSRSRKRPDREMTWLKAFEREVEGRLKTSLHNQILINLDKQAQPEQVHRLWDMEVKSGQITETILPETEILEVFDRPEIAGKLLILGKPGAGKTTTLLELARALVRKALDDPSEPMPFLLNLSSWKDPKQSIKEWAIAELITKGVGSELSAKWFAEQKLLPLLDGLDEVRADLQPACVKAINQWLGGGEQPRAIVVCSRREEYELYPEKLHLNGAIYLEELSDEQIESYLEKVDRLALLDVLSQDAELLDLVRQPLLLSITLVAYRSELAAQWQELRYTQERIKFLLDAYLERMLHRTINSRMYGVKKEPTSKQTCQWLMTLAQQLERESQTEFLIEKMQTTWLRTRTQRWLYLFLNPLHITGFIYLSSLLSLYFLVFTGKQVERSSWMIYALLFSALLFSGGIIYLFCTGGFDSKVEVFEKINVFETVNWSWKRARIGITQSLEVLKAEIEVLKAEIEVLKARIHLYLLTGCNSIPKKQSLASLSVPIFEVLSVLLSVLFKLPSLLLNVVILSTCWVKAGVSFHLDLDNRIRPNEGIQRATAIASAIGEAGLCSALSLGLLVIEASKRLYPESIGYGLLPWLAVAYPLCFVLSPPGKACVQHFSLRLVLFLNRAIPWNYARFLNYATERMFLQRIGGRYRFIHKLLQDHFAAMSHEN
ncbi:NACHT domain-containing protein [Phormidesmis sp. 146-33]